MKKLLFKIVIFLCIVLPPMYLLDYVVTTGLRKCYYNYGCLTDIYNSKINADVLIVGSSRAKFHYSPFIIDSILHTNSYNIGTSGYPFHMQHCLLQLYLKHNKKPKYIIQNVDAFLLDRIGRFVEAEDFIPYAHDSIVTHYTRDLSGAFTFPELHFPLFIYNNQTEDIYLGIKSYFSKGMQGASKTQKGFLPNDGKWNTGLQLLRASNPFGMYYGYDNGVYKEFLEFLDFCKTEDIKVVLVYAPIYYRESELFNNREDLDEMFKNISKTYNLPYLDYSYDSMCYRRKYFFDSHHLNAKGAAAFSHKLAVDLHTYVKVEL